MPGFFVQSEATGPALVVQVDPAAVAAGDMVSFRVTEVETRIGYKRASAIADLVVASSGNDLSGHPPVGVQRLRSDQRLGSR